MKRTLLFACIIMAFATSCNDANMANDETNNGDTAVLVEDPNNTLEANPVNDTTVGDTIQPVE